jgi:NitT/TauT family transport system substrate-binding protein
MKKNSVSLWALLGIIVALVAAVLIIFPNSTQRVEHPTQANMIRVGYIPIADCAQLYVAIDAGLFAKRGLSVTALPLAGGARILEALGSGDLDVGFSNYPSVMLAVNAGLPYRVFAGGATEDLQHEVHALLVTSESSITSPQQLRGKTIAVNTRSNINELMLIYYLRQNGISENDVRLVEIPFPEMLNALSTGAIDAAAAIEPYVSKGTVSMGSMRILARYTMEVQPKLAIAGWASTSKWLSENPEIETKFEEALAEADELIKSQPAVLLTAMGKYTKIDQADLQTVQFPLYSVNTDRALLQDTATKMVAIRWLQRGFDVGSILAH